VGNWEVGNRYGAPMIALSVVLLSVGYIATMYAGLTLPGLDDEPMRGLGHDQQIAAARSVTRSRMLGVLGVSHLGIGWLVLYFGVIAAA
jgi:hypothetical protein